MDAYQEAVRYLGSWHVPVEFDADVLEEHVFQEEAASGCLSPLQAEGVVDFPDVPVSSRFIHFAHACSTVRPFSIFGFFTRPAGGD